MSGPIARTMCQILSYQPQEGYPLQCRSERNATVRPSSSGGALGNCQVRTCSDCVAKNPSWHPDTGTRFDRAVVNPTACCASRQPSKITSKEKATQVGPSKATGQRIPATTGRPTRIRNSHPPRLSFRWSSGSVMHHRLKIATHAANPTRAKRRTTIIPKPSLAARSGGLGGAVLPAEASKGPHRRGGQHQRNLESGGQRKPDQQPATSGVVGHGADQEPGFQEDRQQRKSRPGNQVRMERGKNQENGDPRVARVDHGEQRHPLGVVAHTDGPPPVALLPNNGPVRRASGGDLGLGGTRGHLIPFSRIPEGLDQEIVVSRHHVPMLSESPHRLEGLAAVGEVATICRDGDSVPAGGVLNGR